MLLASHTTWFRLQRCKDRFEACLGINALRAAQGGGSGAAAAAPPPPPPPPPRDSDPYSHPDSRSDGEYDAARLDAVAGGGGREGGDRAGGAESSDGDLSEDDEDGLSEDIVLLTMVRFLAK